MHSVFYPALARLFSAIGELDRVPPGLLDGVLSAFHKAGDRSNPANYRPITLLNTDYRLLAKLLANRLALLLPRLIDPEQTGFVSGRCGGENIHLLQLLPHLLERQGRWGVAVCLDVAKAYDTVDRGFLLSTAERLGLGTGFVRWVRLLLTATSARARVQGHLSPSEAFSAGVRQGCPLAPLLYLLVALAMLRLLKARGFGIQVAGRLLTAAPFADECQALLAAASVPQLEERLRAFLDAMGVFKRATNQALSDPKTVVLPLGRLPAAGLPDTLCGLRVVQQTRVLGVQLHAGTAAPTMDWEAAMERVSSCLSRVAGLKLSPFGYAAATSGYALSQILYHAEYAGLPPPAMVATVMGNVAKLVDGGRAPGSSGRRFTHVRAELLPGPPSSGGFGLLPLEAHIRARWAAWLYRLVAGDGHAPWEAVAAELLARLQPGMTPLGLLAWGRTPAVAARLPQPLRRWCEGALALPAAQLLDQPETPPTDPQAQAEDGGGTQPLPPHAPDGWHAALPIMWSPLVRQPEAEGGGCLGEAYYVFAREAGVTTLGDLLLLRRRVEQLQPIRPATRLFGQAWPRGRCLATPSRRCSGATPGGHPKTRRCPKSTTLWPWCRRRGSPRPMLSSTRSSGKSWCCRARQRWRPPSPGK